MPHKFDFKNKDRLDSPERKQMLPPEQSLLKAGLKLGDIFVDIGCGTGYFSIPASRIVGKDGKVFALDISQEMIAFITDKIRKDGSINNIVVLKSDSIRFPLPDNTATIVLVSNVLHESDDKPGFIREISRILASRRRLAIIEWNKIHSDKGPPYEDRISGDEIKLLIEKEGFLLKTTESLSKDQALYLCEKQ